MLIIKAPEQGPICILVGSAGHAGFGIKRLTAILTIAFKKSAGAAGVGKMTAQDGLVGGAGGGMVAILSCGQRTKAEDRASVGGDVFCSQQDRT